MRFVYSMILLVFLSTFGHSQKRIFDVTTFKWGLKADNGVILLPTIYDEIQPNMDTIMMVKKGGKMGAINEKGEFRIPLIYDYIQPNFNGYKNPFGYAAVTKNAKQADSWGLVDMNGKTVIPEKYKYVRPIASNLFVARAERDSVLQFFDKKGNFLYGIVGKYVTPSDVDNTCFMVEQFHGLDQIGYHMDGKMVYPSNPKLGRWTDKERTILWDESLLGSAKAGLGMINSKGDTLLPFKYYAILHPVEGQFLAKTAHYGGYAGVFDKKGKTIIPEGKHDIDAWGKLYIVSANSPKKQAVYDQQGKEVLPMGQSISHYYAHYDDNLKPKNRHFDYYKSGKDPEGNLYLLKNDGQIFRYEGATFIEYISEDFPLIVQLKNEEKNVLENVVVRFDGKVLIPRQYSSIDFTADPEVFIVEGIADKKGAIVGFHNLKTDNKSPLVSPFLQLMASGYYKGLVDGQFHLFDSKGNVFYKGVFTMMDEPEEKQIKYFGKNHPNEGHLIASGYRPGMLSEDRIGITILGKEVVFKASDYPEPEIEVLDSAEPPMEKMVEMENPSPTILEEKEVSLVTNPTYTGGTDAMLTFIKNNLSYPSIAHENGIEGTVVIRFKVLEDGSLSDFKIMRDIGGGCGQEALRIVKLMPNFIPAEKDGKKVATLYNVPIKFKLTK